MKFVFPYRFYKLWTTLKKERDKRGPLDTGIVLNAIYYFNLRTFTFYLFLYLYIEFS